MRLLGHQLWSLSTRGSEGTLLVKKIALLVLTVLAICVICATTAVYAQVSTDQAGNIILTPASLYMLFGVCALVVPLTAWVTSLAKDVAAIRKEMSERDEASKRSDHLIEKGIEVGERMAVGMEALAKIPSPSRDPRTSDPNRGRRY